MTGLPVPLYQRMADKQLTSERRVNLAVIYFAPGDNRPAADSKLSRRDDPALRPLEVLYAL